MKGDGVFEGYARDAVWSGDGLGDGEGAGVGRGREGWIEREGRESLFWKLAMLRSVIIIGMGDTEGLSRKQNAVP